MFSIFTTLRLLSDKAESGKQKAESKKLKAESRKEIELTATAIPCSKMSRLLLMVKDTGH